MTPSDVEAKGYERVNKYPKSTKFGRQNPISKRWNSEEQLIEWRKAWAEVINCYLQQYGHDARIVHHSHAERGLGEQAAIHEGVIAHALTEKKEMPVIHVLKHRDLAKRIAELTEDLEELRSEKAVLFQQLQFPEDATADGFRKEIPTLEAGLKKLETSEARYQGMPQNWTMPSNSMPGFKSRRQSLTLRSCTKQGRRYALAMNEAPYSVCRNGK